VRKFLFFFFLASFSISEPFIPNRWPNRWVIGFNFYKPYPTNPLTVVTRKDTSLILSTSILSGEKRILLEGITSALVIDPRNPRKFYVGGKDSEGCACVYKTLNGGKEFLISELPSCKEVSWVTIDPEDSEVLFVIQGRKVYQSKDGGGSWRLIFRSSTHIPGAVFKYKNKNKLLILLHEKEGVSLFQIWQERILVTLVEERGRFKIIDQRKFKGASVIFDFQKGDMYIEVGGYEKKKSQILSTPVVTLIRISETGEEELDTYEGWGEKIYLAGGYLFKTGEPGFIYLEKEKEWRPVEFGDWRWKKVIDSSSPKGYRKEKKWIKKMKIVYITELPFDNKIAFFLKEDSYSDYYVTLPKFAFSSKRKEFSFKVEE